MILIINEIKTFAEQIKIPFLVHFTNISNVKSIFTHGLLSRDAVNNKKLNAAINDTDRHDKRTHTVSTSIAHPNDLMFYKYRKKDEDWVVIKINKKVLWDSSCMFFKHNAANGTMSSLIDQEVKGIDALKSLYEKSNSIERQGLESYDPTDVQAEVLIEGGVKLDDLLEIVLSSTKAKDDLKIELNELNIINTIIKVYEPNKGCFAKRSYRRACE